MHETYRQTLNRLSARTDTEPTPPAATLQIPPGYSDWKTTTPNTTRTLPEDAITDISTAPREPSFTLGAAWQALRLWTPRQFLAAAGFSVLFALLIGLPTVLIPNPVFGREIAVLAWNYPVWIGSSVLAGMLAATYVRPVAKGSTAPVGSRPEGSEGSKQSKFGIAGTVLAWFAVGCPVCNKLALLALGYSGVLTWFAPFQPVLAVAALLLTGGALIFRLRGQVSCPVSAAPTAAVSGAS